MYFEAIRKYLAPVFHQDLEQSRLRSCAHRERWLALEEQLDALRAGTKSANDDASRRQMRSQYRMRIAMTQSEQARQVVFRDFRKSVAGRGHRICGFIQLAWHHAPGCEGAAMPAISEIQRIGMKTQL